MDGKRWDVFVSHASEDKESFVRPLAVALRSLGVSGWYDEFPLRLGDSISHSIDRGLADSRFGLVVVTPSFMRKPWTEYELRGLVAREAGEDRVIIPLWHGVTRDQVIRFSPPLADKIALDTKGLDAHDVAIRLVREIRPDLYAQHPRLELERLVGEAAIATLQAELEATREELSEYRCPHCGAEMEQRVEVEDPEGRDSDALEQFACGLELVGGFVRHPCAADPRFPKFEDYELRLRHNPAEGAPLRWTCCALGKTDMARRVSVSVGYGPTREEAQQQTRSNYDSIARRADPYCSTKQGSVHNPGGGEQ